LVVLKTSNHPTKETTPCILTQIFPRFQPLSRTETLPVAKDADDKRKGMALRLEPIAQNQGFATRQLWEASKQNTFPGF